MSATLEQERFASKLRPFPRYLEPGMHLSQPDFHRYYEQEPKDVRAELVKGVVIMASPHSKWHGEACAHLTTCLGLYSSGVIGVRTGLSSSVILDFSNEYQPDLHLRLSEELGGQCRESGIFLHGAPELIVEVALTSFSYDLHEKLEVYQNHRVQEYLVWRGDKNQFTCYRLEDGSFAPVAVADGVFKSAFFRGLWIDLSSLAAGNLKKALETTQAGLQSPEAHAFRAELESRRSK